MFGRYKVKKAVSKRIFSKGANRTNTKNLSSKMMKRGGSIF